MLQLGLDYFPDATKQMAADLLVYHSKLEQHEHALEFLLKNYAFWKYQVVRAFKEAIAVDCTGNIAVFMEHAKQMDPSEIKKYLESKSHPSAASKLSRFIKHYSIS
jgi:hypothetical protein